MARFLDAAPADLEPSCGNAPCNSVPANGRRDNNPVSQAPCSGLSDQSRRQGNPDHRKDRLPQVPAVRAAVAGGALRCDRSHRRHRLLPAVVMSDTRLVPQITVEGGADGGISLKRIVTVGCAVLLAVGMAAFGLPR